MLIRTICPLDKAIPALGTRQLVHPPTPLVVSETGISAIVLQPLSQARRRAEVEKPTEPD